MSVRVLYCRPRSSLGLGLVQDSYRFASSKSSETLSVMVMISIRWKRNFLNMSLSLNTTNGLVRSLKMRFLQVFVDNCRRIAMEAMEDQDCSRVLLHADWLKFSYLARIAHRLFGPHGPNRHSDSIFFFQVENC